MGLFKHPHTDQLQHASGAAADFLLGKGYVEVDVVPVEDLKGAALDEALRDAGLPITGKADEKRAALAEHLANEGAELHHEDDEDDIEVDVVIPTDPTQ